MEKQFVEIPPEGELEKYRKLASFNWKSMKIYLEGDEVITYKNEVYKILSSDPLFKVKQDNLSQQEKFNATIEQFKRLFQIEITSPKYLLKDERYLFYLLDVLGTYDWSLAIKRYLSVEIPRAIIRAIGLRFDQLIDDLESGKFVGSIALTEIGGGSNLQGLQTTATYEAKTETFILHSPNFKSWKCWAANIGISATHTVALCQLYTENGQCQGLHFFAVPIRDPQTLKPYPGVTVGNMGHKIGLHGLDNGFLAFKNYRIPRTSLLNGISDVTPSGTYKTLIENTQKRFAMTAGTLSLGRIGTATMCTTSLKKVMVYSIRYAICRKQFALSNETEDQSLLEYSLHQWRLLPYLSSYFVLFCSNWSIVQDYLKYIATMRDPRKDTKGIATPTEMHILISSAKSFCSWLARDAIQESREACGAHGFLHASGIGTLRNDNDAKLTLEGDNNILILQVCKILLNTLIKKKQDGSASSGLGLLYFLDDMPKILSSHCDDKNEFKTLSGIVKSYQWLVCFILSMVSSMISDLLQSGKDENSALNLVPPSCFQDLFMAFTEWVYLIRFQHHLQSNKAPPECEKVLKLMGMHFGYWRLDRHVSTFYRGGYFIGFDPSSVIHKELMEIGAKLKNEAVALVDAIAPPDCILGSILGQSDGDIYTRFQDYLLKENCSLPTLSS